IAAGSNRWRRAATRATNAVAEVRPLTTVALSRGRRLIHSSSPSIARVDQARSCRGLPKTNGLAAIHTASQTAWLRRRVHAGTRIRGVLAQRVHALHGLQCRAKSARRSLAMDGTRGYFVAVLECWAGTTTGATDVASPGDPPGNGARGTPG